MTELLPLDPDQLLTTTRSVRKRLDLNRPVSLDIIREALDVALQAPSGSNSQGWHWIVIDDAEKKRRIADLYRKSFAPYIAAQGERDETGKRVASSASYLAEVLERVPVFVIGAIHVGKKGLPEGNQAGVWGSLLPAAWSLQLALRARGLGSAWTTLHLVYEREVAEILGIPDGIAQGVLLPVAYYTGTDFKPAPRRPIDEVLHINEW
ncbi:putative oxidoreductase [Gordonia araii NBRC 100433]|uniref:Putative oxidoreductase n=1 Tax=Gordonia araii NBRC 100433 TaxID=1073574 RepID=G7H3I5_9ACTN|nr:nitroreductase family protein [Gordonia araii]NNG96528.1 nitroreductase family protein [Gordonia araii NBRC 100433]GAB10410.1 putative oxidoreductase [Gordonia araii NBRC 100433]